MIKIVGGKVHFISVISLCVSLIGISIASYNLYITMQAKRAAKKAVSEIDARCDGNK